MVDDEGLLLLLSTGGGGIPDGEVGIGTCEGDRTGGGGGVMPNFDFRDGECWGMGGGGKCEEEGGEGVMGGGGGGALEGGGGELMGGGVRAKESGRKVGLEGASPTSLLGLIIGTRAMSSANRFPVDGPGTF